MIILSDAELKQLKDIQLTMLKEFKKICELLHLKYFLIGGTLLGAVRHHGFIPWDDDIDVGMFRKDYDIFITEAQKYFSKDLFLQTYKTDPNAPFLFAKIRNCKTTYIETTVKNIKMNHGIFIDIFPIDYYPEKKFFQRLLKLERQFIECKTFGSFYLETPLNCSLKGKIGKWIANRVFKSVAIALDIQNQILKSIKPSKLVINYSGAWGEREILPISWLENVIVMEFEEIMFYVPKMYDNYLRNLYGNYMKLPPIEERIGHHYVEIIDFNKSYTEYTSN